MQTRSSVLGKRQSSPDVVASPSTPSKSSTSRNANVLPTPDNTPNAKRVKLSETVHDGHNNKENIPPLRVEAINSLLSPSRNRRIARTNSTDQVFPARRESCKLFNLSLTPIFISFISVATICIALATPCYALTRAVTYVPGYPATDPSFLASAHFLSCSCPPPSNMQRQCLHVRSRDRAQIDRRLRFLVPPSAFISTRSFLPCSGAS